MAQKPVNVAVIRRKQELLSQLANSRRQLTSARSQLKGQLHPKAQLTSLVSKNPKKVLIGTAVLGLIMTSLFRPKGSHRNLERQLGKVLESNKALGHKIPKKGVIITLLGWGVSLAKPSIQSWLTTKASSFATQQMNQRLYKVSSHRESK